MHALALPRPVPASQLASAWRRALPPERLLLLGILGLVGAAHAINLFHFPYYEADEGTYMSQAWALVTKGSLAPYTYTYDHAPGGWILIAAWAVLTGGFHTFGNIIDSGRVLMLVLQLLSTSFVYRIGRELGRSLWVGALAALLFGLSAYSIYFHRRVLLDNIATFWMLAAIALVVTGRLTLHRAFLGALAMAISVLSKEVTVFVIPAVCLLVLVRSREEMRAFAVTGFLALVTALGSLYVLMAGLRGEIFPPGTWLGGTQRHVSMLCTLQYEASRVTPPGGGALNPGSAFWRMALS